MKRRTRPGRLLIADDQAIGLVGAVQVLTAAGFEICETVDEADRIAECADASEPDLVIVEPAMGRVDVVMRQLQMLAAARPTLPVVLFTGELSGPVVLAAIESGCRGVLPKASSPDALVEVVGGVLRGERHVHPRALALALDHRRPATPTMPLRVLSPREIAVVGLVAEGLTNREIADELGIGAETVKTHLSNAQTKLQAKDRTHLVTRAWRAGLLD